MAGLLVSVVTLGLFISAHLSITALEGTCLLIPSNFSTNNGTFKLHNATAIFGAWTKNQTDFGLLYLHNVIFNSSTSNNSDPIRITGNLTEDNCTTRLSYLNQTHDSKFYFRIESGPFREKADCYVLEITVKDSPWKPRVSLISGGLKENQSVTITCSAVTPCPHSPPELSWNLQQDSHSQTEKNNDGTFTTKIQKNITLSDAHDGYKIICSVRYPVNEGKDLKTAETEETLRVSYAPKKTSASVSPAGTRVKLTCSSRASPPVNFTWFKKCLHGDVKVADGDFYGLNETDGGVYYCVAANDLGNQTSSDVHLHGFSDGSPHLMSNLVRIIGIIFLVVCVCTVTCLKRTKKLKSTEQQLELDTYS